MIGLYSVQRLALARLILVQQIPSVFISAMIAVVGAFIAYNVRMILIVGNGVITQPAPAMLENAQQKSWHVQSRVIVRVSQPQTARILIGDASLALKIHIVVI